MGAVLNTVDSGAGVLRPEGVGVEHAYRPEIDGLRALAVLPVVLFHGGVAGFGGGFVGVDIFFVISGYLIASIIIRDLAADRFSVLDFYERRARRILPALFAVMLISMPLALFLMFPEKLIEFGESVLATVAFGSNILFWRDSGYFATVNELKPLLHTWSLAVEEQFYVFFPLALAALWALGLRLKGLAIAISLAAVGSFMLADWASFRMIAASFYLLPMRAWELLAGAVMAFWTLRRTAPVGPLAEGGGVLGILMIVAAIVFLDGAIPWPGRWALLPVVGTALVILYAGPKTVVGRLLSLRPVVAVGLVSYSAYLWHQPLFAFARVGSPGEPSHLLMVGLAVLTFALAWLTWRFVEKPFRNRKWLRRRDIFRLSALGMLGFSVMSGAMIWGNGLPGRFDAVTLDLISASEENGRGSEGCFPAPELPEGGCRFHQQLSERVLLWGDSHAMAFAEALAQSLSEQGIGLDTLTSSGCLPVAEVTRVGRPACDVDVVAHWQYVSSASAPSLIMIHGRWTLGFEDSNYDNGEGGVEHNAPSILARINGMTPSGPQAQWLATDLQATVRMITASDRHVILIGNIPEAGWDVPRYMALRRRWGLDDGVPPSVSFDLFKARDARTVAALAPLSSSDRVTLISPSSLFCDVEIVGRCVLAREGRALYRDDDHLSRYGAQQLAAVVARAIVEGSIAEPLP